MEWGNPWTFFGLALLPVLWWWGRGRLSEVRPWLSRLALGLRGLILALLLTAMAQPTWLLPEQRTDWLFLVDHSDSMTPAAIDSALVYLDEAEARLPTGDRMAVMSFGADTSLDVPFGENLRGAVLGADVDRGATHIENAIQAALAEFDGSSRQRIVLLSDGNQTVGDARNTVIPLSSRGVRLFAASPAVETREGEVVLENLVLPSRVKRGDAFTMEVVVASTVETDAVLELFRDREPLGQYRVKLEPGRNLFPVDLVAEEEGQRLFRAVINSKADRHRENNGFQRFLAVEGGSKVLLVYGDADHSRALVDALNLQDMRVTAVGMGRLPATIQELLQYDVVIFDNAPGLTLSHVQMEMIESYVKDFGGGFVMIGGEKSFGGGGYHDTPMAAMLPVDMDVAGQAKIPSVALLLVIDRSDSMGGPVTETDLGGSKLEVAKLASFSAMQLLNPTDRVGLISFDTAPYWSVPMIEAGKREEISAKLAKLEPGGGTDLYVGLKAAVDHLSRIRAYKKHIIALSDGLTPVREFEALVKGAAAHRITLSTVALGDEADRKLLTRLADWGKGRHYFTNDSSKIPRIFITETIMISRQLVEEVEFRPKLRMAHEILKGLPGDDLPPLLGYVITTAKPSAEVVLTASDQDPLLAVWHYGLGRSVAFTSDLSTAWGRHWVRWPGYPRLVAQLVRWAERRDSGGNLEITVRSEGERAAVVANLYDESGRFLNEFKLLGRVTYPDQSVKALAFFQDAPGRYRGEFPLAQSGEYLLTVSGKRGEETVGPRNLGLTVPYAAEYRYREPNLGLLAELAEATQGALLPGQAGAALDMAIEEMMAAEGGELVRKPIWHYFVVAAMFLFLIDIASRQFGWLPSRRDEERLRARRGDRTESRTLDLGAEVASRAGKVRRRV